MSLLLLLNQLCPCFQTELFMDMPCDSPCSFSSPQKESKRFSLIMEPNEEFFEKHPLPASCPTWRGPKPAPNPAVGPYRKSPHSAVHTPPLREWGEAPVTSLSPNQPLCSYRPCPTPWILFISNSRIRDLGTEQALSKVCGMNDIVKLARDKAGSLDIWEGWNSVIGHHCALLSELTPLLNYRLVSGSTQMLPQCLCRAWPSGIRV